MPSLGPHRALLLAIAGVVLAAAALAPGPSGADDRAATDGPDLDVTLVVADLRGRALFVLDTSEPPAARRIALPGGPHELLRLPDGRVLVSLEQAGMLAAVDLVTGAVETREVGGLPHGLAQRGGVVYVTDRAPGALRRFEAAGALGAWRELPSLPAGEWPHAVALTAGTPVVADAASDALLLGDTAVPAPELPETVAITPGGRIATAGAMDGVLRVLSPGGAVLLDVLVGGRPVRVAFSPDGDTIALALSAEGSVALVDREGGVRRVETGGVPDGLAFSPDGAVVFVSDVTAGRLAAVDVERARLIDVFAAGESTGAVLVLDPR